MTLAALKLSLFLLTDDSFRTLPGCDCAASCGSLWHEQRLTLVND